jgi:plastocyanin
MRGLMAGLRERLVMTHSRLVLVPPFSLGLVAAAALALPADGSITGTVKATGLPSSADAVVYVQDAKEAAKPPAAPVSMDQRKMQFIPHVLPVVVGTTVRFLNSDPTPHNVFSPDFEKYNLGTWPQGQTKDHTFAQCAKFPCVYTQLCRVHPEMEGFVIVLPSRHFAVSDKEGHYEITGVPPGSYTVAVWHPKLKAAPKPVTVEAGAAASVEFTLGR